MTSHISTFEFTFLSLNREFHIGGGENALKILDV